MIRETLNAGATSIFFGDQIANGTSAFEYRTTTGGSANGVGGNSTTLPYWYMLVRSGNTFTAYTSVDGLSWSRFTSETITMATNVYVGLAVSSYDDTDLATAVFDDVSISSTASPAPLITSVSNNTGSVGSQIQYLRFRLRLFPRLQHGVFE